ncbi:Pentatricopeptide repeat-containing protein [Heracleum sosnowskyi]|uniref:Pentatricopeptide repeat-containing protein n=1 Tax=Heracleum sosnowskyi TaxID=360622 RepID=A0AAD8JJK8_9APIA|nr:Pentatricopeptide repeat-containing protein [Heracleum sosnowskyi]
MLSLPKSSKASRIFHYKKIFFGIAFFSTSQCPSSADIEIQVRKLTKLINDSPYPDKPLHPVLSQQIPPNALSTSIVENVLGSLFATHANGLKASEFFRYTLQAPHLCPSADAFEKTLHILTRMRYFDKAWELIEEIKKKYPSLLTIKSMSIVLSRIARFQSFEETLEAFERMENDIYIRNKFGTEEFNILLRAFCTQRQMKEARSVFNKLHSRFSPNTKTMNILLLGFKESGDITSVELFYHDMTRRGFKPNNITYNIRIDAYCKKGIVRNKSKAKELFDEISRRNLQADTGAYNALISSLIRCRDVKSAAGIMDEMDGKNVSHDNVTYHTMFSGFMKSKDIDGFYGLYQKMIERNFMPKTSTVVMLMKLFCENKEIDLAVNLWVYLIERGYCPHSHALNLLVTALCSRGRLEEAFECSKQMLERGRHISDLVFRMLERCLREEEGMEKLRILDKLIKRLSTVLPPSRGQNQKLIEVDEQLKKAEDAERRKLHNENAARESGKLQRNANTKSWLWKTGTNANARVKAKWIPPTPGRLKINVDAAVSGSVEGTGIGVAVRNEYGKVIAASTSFLSVRYDVLAAETRAIKEGLYAAAFFNFTEFTIYDVLAAETRAIKESLYAAAFFNFTKFTIESDCQNAIAKIRHRVLGGTCSDLDVLVYDIHSLVKHARCEDINFFFREANIVAHSLAQIVIESKPLRHLFRWVSEFPIAFSDSAEADMKLLM